MLTFYCVEIVGVGYHYGCIGQTSLSSANAFTSKADASETLLRISNATGYNEIRVVPLVELTADELAFIEAQREVKPRQSRDTDDLRQAGADILSALRIDQPNSFTTVTEQRTKTASSRSRRDATLRHLWKCCGVVKMNATELRNMQSAPQTEAERKVDSLAGSVDELTQLVAELIECLLGDI